ncbi:hypothetical protein B5E84_12625 [Lachnoclostridium sp. An14]|uniref:hypothetical protein n=1 Tax=Lachnoclostridium sp. An14 TaxID=1965562 RepID=UPI000B3684BE|nr:hypothetical protein [Lachnoclostridium sp. An14]OUQ16214.1 hypothetical protein B5E84_12625 [Lachnoclostridium sp. An14]
MELSRIISIDFGYCLIVLKKSIPRILVAAMVGTAIGILAALLYVNPENSYRALATVYSFADGSYDESAQGLNALKVYSEIVKSRKVAERARVLLGPTHLTVGQIYDMISTDARVIQGSTYVYENNTAVLKIYADSSRQTDSVAVVNAVADAFVQEINNLSDSNTMRVLDYSQGAGKTYDATKQRSLTVIFCTVGGAFVYILIRILTVVLSFRIETLKDVQLYGQLAVLGVIPNFKE